MDINIEFWLNAIIPPLLLFIGLSGNILGLKVLTSKKLDKIGPRCMYKLLFISDSFILIEIIVNYLQYAYTIDVTIVSNLSCKTFHFLNYSLATISPMILVYISIERFMSVKYPTKVKLLRNTQNQLGYFFLIILYNFIYYVPIPIYIDLIETEENNTLVTEALTGCDFIDSTAKEIISYLDLTNRTIVPFVLMSICSFMLIKLVIASRLRTQGNNSTTAERRRSKRDTKLGITLICVNFIYILFNLPYSIAVFLKDYNTNPIYIFSYYLFYSSFAVNFYIILLTNSLFRQEFLYVIRINVGPTSTSII